MYIYEFLDEKDLFNILYNVWKYYILLWNFRVLGIKRRFNIFKNEKRIGYI